MFDILSDIFSALSKNKLRTALTGFAMAWGIFMLIVLLGCGKGIENATMLNFRGTSTNTVMLFPWRTTMPYKGFQMGRRILIDDDALNCLKDNVPEIGRIAPTRMVWDVLETYGGEYTSGGGLYGITSEYCELTDFRLVKGRNINPLDDKLKRKVIILHKSNVEVLFKGEDPIGKYVVVNNVPYLVIGIYANAGRDQNQPDVIPLSTMMKVYSRERGYGRIILEVNGVRTKQESDAFEDRLRKAMAGQFEYNPQDKSAVWIWNANSNYLESVSIFAGINFFLWLINLGTLIAGIMGVGNIMLVTVKERTKEFGIRKSLGAKPRSIIALILTESVIITSFFGYLGMLCGVGLLDLLSKIFPEPSPENMENVSFVNPSVNLSIAVIAILLLVVAGLVAAYIPAKKAVEVKPIEALHYE